MKLFIVVACALVAIATAAPQNAQPVEVVENVFKQEVDGAYNLVIRTSDGSERRETGQVREVNNEEGKPVRVLIVDGSYKYVDPEGHDQLITYQGDQDGFHAQGDSIPKNVEPNRR